MQNRVYSATRLGSLMTNKKYHTIYSKFCPSYFRGFLIVCIETSGIFLYYFRVLSTLTRSFMSLELWNVWSGYGQYKYKLIYLCLGTWSTEVLLYSYIRFCDNDPDIQHFVHFLPQAKYNSHDIGMFPIFGLLKKTKFNFGCGHRQYFFFYFLEPDQS